MKKNMFLRTIIFLFLAIIVSGVFTAYADENKDIMKFADSAIVILTKGMETKNYDMYIKPWSPETRKLMTKDKFNTSCAMTLKNIGTLKSKKFYDIQKQGDYRIIQWKGLFSKIPDELYLRLVIKKIDNKYYVEGHWISPEPFKIK